MMSVDQLARHLDQRLNKQDEERKAIAKDVSDLKVSMGKVETAGHNARGACAARHASNKSRIGRMEKGFVGLGVAALAACAEFVRNAVTSKGGG